MDNDDPEIPRKAVWPPPRRGIRVTPPAAVAPIVVPLPAQPTPPEGLAILERGKAGLLSHRYHLAWEDSLTGAEYDKWRKMQAILDSASPEFRAAAMNQIILSEIDNAKARRAEAEEEGKKFKVDIIDRGIVGMSAQIERLDAAFCEGVKALSALSDAIQGITRAANEMDAAINISQVEIAALRMKAGPWNSAAPGAEYGAGISGYDSPRNVERLASQHRQEWEAKHAPKQPPPQSPPQQTAPPKPTTPPGPTGPLFGR